ncbi:MFS transporter [Candidatus Izemoplasma sp. B36]|uniref:MFS transporter n=1 Tax=Candidatus Izemoplasma sp. B36 TaxID=3242468 RepID=UPI003557E8F2
MKLNYKKTFYVGLAFLLITLFWRTYDLIIAKILIDKFGLNQFVSGIIMSLDNVLALFLIPLFGSLSDKKKSKRGRRTPYIIVGTIIAAFAFLSLTFADNFQQAKIESETAIVEEYNDFYDNNLEYDFTDWQDLRDGIILQWQELKDDGVIDQEAYDSFYEEVIDGDDTGDETNPDALDYEKDNREGMNEIFTYSAGDLDNEDLKDLRELYYLHLNKRAWIVTSRSPFTFIVFMVVLLAALLSMATFRSPAVALMPDVTIKPLRSKGNAVINLMGTVGGIIATVMLMAFALDGRSYVNYAPAFIITSALMLVLLAIFLWKVKEPKLVKEKEEMDKQYNLVEVEEESEVQEKLPAAKRKSLLLILFSVALWFIGYNAVMSKLSDYAPKVLGLDYGLPIIIAQMAALIAFIPIGILATRIGRKKTILIGIIALTVCFGTVYFLTPSTAFLMYIIFALTGVAWATINVNSYPMVVELAKGSDVGKYTGYYYTFSMSAQIVTPILSGLLMDSFGRTILFPYAALFVLSSFVTMFFVKHGDFKAPKKGDVLESFDVDVD